MNWGTWCFVIFHGYCFLGGVLGFLKLEKDDDDEEEEEMKKMKNLGKR